ncbi:hypothetical protein Patl1_13741 [Pistacia atlantica]|uniref:Uncharacterized protein n=1 Tax=Pistacia atlantica TaxID=434234 RepID=A0ACC1ATT9_9ROSI|nr:hypothetical protein Patl1_13741 [Pistacia atlantica]
MIEFTKRRALSTEEIDEHLTAISVQIEKTRKAIVEIEKTCFGTMQIKQVCKLQFVFYRLQESWAFQEEKLPSLWHHQLTIPVSFPVSKIVPASTNRLLESSFPKVPTFPIPFAHQSPVFEASPP